MPHPWQTFFDSHAPKYMENVFTRNTEAELAFLLEELKPVPGARLLDLGCGTGRHAVGLAKLGYRVTGVDLSQGMLDEARQAAEAAGVQVEWVHANALDFRRDAVFDAALCLCEGAFALLAPDEDPLEHDALVLRNIAMALKPGAPFILTTLNACRLIRCYGSATPGPGTFDPMTLVERNRLNPTTLEPVPEGAAGVTTCERSYTVPELRRLFPSCGLRVRNVWGGTAGNWGRRPLELDEYEIMVVAERSSQSITP